MNRRFRIFLTMISAFLVLVSGTASAKNLSYKAAERIALQCQAAANKVNTEHSGTVLFRPKTGVGVWWCAVSDREGTLKAIRASDTLENACEKTEFESDAARLSELIAIAKSWTTSFSNNEVAVDSRAAGVNSRIDQFGPPDGMEVGTNNGAAPLWGVWVTNLYRHTDRESGYTCGKRHFGVVPFAGGVPVYGCKSKKLLGGVGASGDSVDADELVATYAITMAGYCTSPDD